MEIWVTENDDPIKVGLTGVEDIEQCVRVLLSTIKETVHMDRKLGIDIGIVDTPMTLLSLKNKEIFEALERSEPRVKVKEIKHNVNNLDGSVRTSVLIEIKERYIR